MRDIKTTELLKILPQKPAFGDKSGMTRWLFFVKEVENNGQTRILYSQTISLLCDYDDSRAVLTIF